MQVGKAVVLLHLAAVPTLPLCAQTEPEYVMEIGVGAGMINYEGDYNGGLFKGGQPSAALVWRYAFNPSSGLRATIDYGKLKGSADNVKTVYPSPADEYSFSNTLIDLNAMYEYSFWPYGTGREYRGAKRFTPYIMAGIGLTYVKTSGGSTATGNVPVGVGVKYKIARRLNLNAEWIFHFSMSDKLDGMKDPYLIESSGIFKNADCYSQLMVNLTYSFKERCRVCHNDRE